jgi:O-antigen/teichoic acid export membrane protein
VSGESILLRTAKGAGWVVLWRLVTRVLGLVSTLFLVRLLQPQDFGLITLATSVSQAIDQFSALGVEEAVIRDPHPSRTLHDSAFTINVIRGVVTCVVLAAGAWPVAAFFGDIRLFPVLLVLSCGALIAAFENIGIVDFRRDIAFDREFILMSVPRLVSICVAITLAYTWHSYWALLAAIQTGNVLRIGMGYVMHPFRPRLRLTEWRRIAGFSLWMWLLSLGGLLSERCPSFVIGRVFSLTQVGVFAVGAEIAALPTTELISPLARAGFSGFASARAPGESALGESRHVFLRMVAATTLVALPAGVGISLVADPIVKLAFGTTWVGATSVVQVLGVALTSSILGYICSALLNAHALLKTMLCIQGAALVVRLGLLIVLVGPLGLLGAALAVGLATMFEHALHLLVTLRYLQLPAFALWCATWRSFAGVAVMIGGLVWLGLGWTMVTGDAGAMVRDLALAVPTGAAIYAGTVGVCWSATGRPDGAERDMTKLAWRAGTGARGVGATVCRRVLRPKWFHPRAPEGF